MISNASDRVALNTEPAINEQIERQIQWNIERYARMGNQAISCRLMELDEEWDIERYVETVAPILTLSGIFLSVTSSRRWLLLSAAVQGFFVQHAIQGWCPPIPVLRRLGIRTMQEINAERTALKALRGDFDGMPSPADPAGTRQALNAATL